MADEKPATGKKAPSEKAVGKALSRVPRQIDASPLPNYAGDFVSLDAGGAWHRPAEPHQLISSAIAAPDAPAADCSRDAIIHFAQLAPSAFETEKKGTLYGVQTHTDETRLTTRYWDMPGFNSCALVVYAILKQAGCSWAKYTANAKGIYDMAYANGWRPATVQEGGCMIAWNSKWQGGRAGIGDRQKQAKGGNTRFRHVGITTGSWLSVDNSSWRSRPTTFFTVRPIVYEPPIFLCPPPKATKQAP